LDARSAAAAVTPGTTPVDAWRRLRKVEGPRATVIDLYEPAARRRGLAADELPRRERHALARFVMPQYLRAHPEARHAYATVKRKAAATWADDGWAYTDAKTDVVLEVRHSRDWSGDRT